MRPPSWGRIWTEEPRCPSGVRGEPSGAEGEKRRGLSGRLSPGNVLWEEEQNFRGTTGLDVSLGSAGGGRDRFLLSSRWVAAPSWVSAHGLDTGVSRAGRRGGPPIPWAPPLSARPSQSPGGCAKAAEKAPEEAPADAARAADEPQLLHGAGICKWFNVRMGFGFLSMTARAGVALDPPVDVFVHQVRLVLVTLLGERGSRSTYARVGGQARVLD